MPRPASKPRQNVGRPETPGRVLGSNMGVPENKGFLRVPLKGYYNGTIRFPLKGSIRFQSFRKLGVPHFGGPYIIRILL